MQNFREREGLCEEDKVDLWIAESFVTEGDVTRTWKKSQRRRHRGYTDTFHSNYYVRLQVGKPPADYQAWFDTRGPDECLELYLAKEKRKDLLKDNPFKEID